MLNFWPKIYSLLIFQETKVVLLEDLAAHFKMKTLPRVTTEIALHVLAYNTMRVMAVVGVPRLIEAVKA